MSRLGVKSCPAGDEQVVLCTIPDDVLSSASSAAVVRMLRQLNRSAIVIATATTFPEQVRLYAVGADYVLMPLVHAAVAARDAVQAALTGQLEDLRERRAPRPRRHVLE